MVRFSCTRRYELVPLKSGTVRIDSSGSQLDGTEHDSRRSAVAAVDRERESLRSQIDADMRSGGPMYRRLMLLALQLQDLDWQALDVEYSALDGLIIFPQNEMLSVERAHEFFENLIADGVHIPEYEYTRMLDEFQAHLFERAAEIQSGP